MWWDKQTHADRRPVLLARNRLQAAIRAHLGAEDFVEVDPGALVISPGNETHLHAFQTALIGNDGDAAPVYLHTSPEFAMKRLLAAGETRIFSFQHVFRNREKGPRHHPEFTLLEWYRAGQDYGVLFEDCAAFLRLTGVARLRYGAATCDPTAAIERLSVSAAFLRHAGIALDDTLDDNGYGQVDALRRECARIGLRTADDDTWSDMFSRVLGEKVEPNLGIGHPVALDRYPACEAALARRCADDPRFAERFELYACGVELANGFGELTDVPEQRQRFVAEMDEKSRRYGERYPIDEDFLAALAHMPPASGMALGFDRLVMLATGAPRVQDVIWTPLV